MRLIVRQAGISFARCQRELKAEQILIQVHVFLDAKIPAIPSPKQLRPVASQQLERLLVRQPDSLSMSVILCSSSQSWNQLVTWQIYLLNKKKRA